MLFDKRYDLDPIELENPNYDVSLDGEHFLMVSSSEMRSQVIVVLNWHQELKRLIPVN